MSNEYKGSFFSLDMIRNYRGLPNSPQRKGTKYIFCQISSNPLNPKKIPTIEEQYYNKFWKLKRPDGYYKPGKDFWEIPKWVAEISHIISSNNLKPGTDIDMEFKILHKPKILPSFNKEHTVYLFSVMDVNKSLIEQIITLNPKLTYGLGGYVKINPNLQKEINITNYSSTKDFALKEDLEYFYGTNYKLFRGKKCIPRLTLSTGCRHKCKFCTTEDKVVPVNVKDILQQLTSFRDLNYKLIYIDDKTFGQCEMSFYLKYLGMRIKKDNKKFKGFIVQTTAVMIWRYPHLFDNPYIYAIEIGVETFNNSILKQMNKPSNEDLIDKAISVLNFFHVNIILNILLGLPGETFETYKHTLDWLDEKHKELYSLNIYSLALYEDSQLGRELPNEIKSEAYHNGDSRAYTFFYDKFFKLGMKILNK